MNNTIFLFFIFLSVQTTLHSQNDKKIKFKIDSIMNLLPLLNGQEKLDAYTSLLDLSYNEALDFQLKCTDDYIKEAWKQGNLEEEGYARSQKIVICYNNDCIDSMLVYLPENMNFWLKHEQLDAYFYAWLMKAMAYNFNRHFGKALQEAESMYNSAKKMNSDYGKGTALLAYGQIYLVMDRLEEAQEALESSIKILQKEEDQSSLVEGYSFLCTSLMEQKKYKEALTVAKEWDELMQRLESNNVEASVAQKFNLYIEYASCYIGMENILQAEKYIRLAEELPVSQIEVGKVQLRLQKVKLYQLQEKYDDALAICDTIYESGIQRGDNVVAGSALYNIGYISGEAGYYKKSADYFYRYIEYNDSIQKKEFASKLDELRTIYEVDRITIEKEKQTIYLFGALLFCFFLLILLFFVFFYSHKLHRKNHLLVQQILEQEKLSAELKEKEKELEKFRKSLVMQFDENENENKEKDNDLYNRLEALVQNEKIYTDVNLSRKMLADLLNTNEKYLFDAIKQHYNLSFSEYITQLRLNHALEILTDPINNYTIETIAFESGFGSRKTFHRIFKERYGLAPDAFRRLAFSDSN